MNLAGHVRLHRKIQNNPLWTQLSPAVLKLFEFCLMEANWKPEKWYDGHAEMTIPRGSFITSYRRSATACNLSLKQVRDGFCHLESLDCTRLVTVRAPGRAHEQSMVTVCQYDGYQASKDDEGHAKGQATGTPMGTRRAHDGHTNVDEPVENQHNVNGINEGDPSNGTPLKEEEVKKERRKTTPLLPGMENDEQIASDNSGPIRSNVPPSKAWFDSSHDVWYKGFWNHESRDDSRRAYEKRIRALAKNGRDFEEAAQFLMEAVVSDKAKFEVTEKWKWRSNMHPATWLNGERWEDEPAAAPVNGSARPPGHKKTFMESVESSMAENLAVRGKVW